MLKKVLTAAVLVLVVALVGCKKQSSEPEGPVTLEMWSFTNELEPVIERYQEQNPDVTINLTIVPNEDYLNKLKPVLRSGTNAPDVYTAEMSNVKDFVASGFWDNLSGEPYNVDVSDLMPYQVEMASDADGNVRGISWQTTPGGFFYKRSFAKEYFGTDDPAEIGAMLDTPEKFLDVARQVNEKSGGAVKMIPGIGDYQRYVLSARKNPFIDKNNKLHIDDEPVLIDFFDLAKTLKDEKLTGEIAQWSPPWFNAMKKDGKIFGFSLPTWGLHYVLKSNAPDSSGDWALTNGPSSYFWGGTWMGVYSKSEKKAAAWKFVSWFTLDEETLTWWAKKTGDFLGNKTVVDKIKGDFSEPYLGGQNHYEYFASEAAKVTASNIGANYNTVQGMYMGAINNYIEGNMSKEEAIADFKKQVKNAYPDTQVD